MKKYIRMIVGALLALTFVIGCDDSFLDEKVLDAYAPETLKDKLGFEAAAIGLYNHFSTFLTTTDDQTILGMFQLGTDIVWNPMGRSNGYARPYHDYATLTSTDGASIRLWRYLYKLINNANILIK
ncbi:MAG: RagB/SusD family nutrient uptake outer membrane protein, partial [Bacteroidales bacterium]|nr:RagB/SusD family nutrient uptake outer membrane protein [Bacteroidales bacterium]